jgi:murein L,D-transpeptidase YcbB/YkuD
MLGHLKRMKKRNTLQKQCANFAKLLTLTGGLALSYSSGAQAYDSWYGGNEDGVGWDQTFDRSAAREWEINPPKGFPTLDKANIPLMKEAVKRYAAIVSAGGWRKMPKGKMGPGNSGQKVALLRKRLELTGDLQKSSSYSTYDYYVERAVKRFQVRHGLTPSGMVDRRTLMALNVPASVRLRQLRTNIARLNGLTRSTAKRYVAVNVPAQQIEVVENGRIVSRHAAVVGKIDRQTPRLRSKIHEINFNPYWNVPRSIVRKDLVPKARSEAKRGRYDLLERFRISALDGNGRKVDPRKINWNSNSVYNYRYRQDPWKDNSMGFVKINFHNKHAVYMHDTPSKSLFGRNLRANSSGCIRVQNVKQLVTWLLKDNKDWSRGRVDQMQTNGERKDVRLKTRAPVYFIYVTSWATRDGTVHFRRDLYKQDGVGATASNY